MSQETQERLKVHIAHFKTAFLKEHPNKKRADVEANAEPTAPAPASKLHQE